MRHRLPAIAAAALLGLFLPSSAAAFYVGASLSQTSAEFETALTSIDADDSGWKAFAGISILKFLGVEASYRDFGNPEESQGASSVEAEITGYDLSALGRLPLGKRFEVFAKAGYANLSTEASITDAGDTVESDEDDGETFFGAGLSWKFGRRLGLRAEYEEFDVDTSLSVWSVGVTFGK
jgi:hypothetical protein